ncbi:MAG: nitroreductase family protein [Chloroflexi bacterium]|nr:nitroreductase family protein [Chloroflexota bacterium]
MSEQYKDNFWQTLLTRRSIRRYEQRAIPDTVIEKLLTAAIWAPSAHNRQPWRFAVVRDNQHKQVLAQRMARRWQHDLEADGVAAEQAARQAQRSAHRITNAAALVIGCLTMQEMDVPTDAHRQRLEWHMAVQSTALALGQLLLAAHHEGLGACWMCTPLFVPELVRTTLALPDDWEPQALITLGYAAESRVSERKLLSEVVLWR